MKTNEPTFHGPVFGPSAEVAALRAELMTAEQLALGKADVEDELAEARKDLDRLRGCVIEYETALTNKSIVCTDAALNLFRNAQREMFDEAGIQ